MANIQTQKPALEESGRWRAYLARRAAAVCSAPLREGFRLAVMPSFGPQRCWTVDRRASRQGPPKAEHLICDSAEDYRRFIVADAIAQASLEPRITRATFELSNEVYQWLDALVSNVVVPLAVPLGPLGTDGSHFFFERRAGGNRIALEWWHQGPEAWQQIALTFDKVWQELERCTSLNRRDSQSGG